MKTKGRTREIVGRVSKGDTTTNTQDTGVVRDKGNGSPYVTRGGDLNYDTESIISRKHVRSCDNGKEGQ